MDEQLNFQFEIYGNVQKNNVQCCSVLLKKKKNSVRFFLHEPKIVIRTGFLILHKRF